MIAQWRGPNSLLLEPGVPSINFVSNALAAVALVGRDHASTALSYAIAQALITHKGVKVDEHPAIRQNSSLQGWSWNEGTFSWVEPTSWCTLAVKKVSRGSVEAEARLAEAEAFLRDRVCQGGGWNHGNSEVYGQRLAAYVPSTAAGVLALQDLSKDPIVQEAAAFLQREAPREGSTTALGMAWVALAAVGLAREGIVAALERRIEIAETVGNVASMGMMLYVLEVAERSALPTAFML